MIFLFSQLNSFFELKKKTPLSVIELAEYIHWTKLQDIFLGVTLAGRMM